MSINDYIYKDTIKYEKFISEKESNTPHCDKAIEIKGLRLNGNIKVTSNVDGDSITSSIVYRVKDRIPKKSKLDGHEVIDCVRIDSPLSNAGYKCYVK